MYTQKTLVVHEETCPVSLVKLFNAAGWLVGSRGSHDDFCLSFSLLALRVGYPDTSS